MYGMRLPANLPQIDAYVHNRLRDRWRAVIAASTVPNNATTNTKQPLAAQSSHTVRSQIQVDTHDVLGYTIPVEAKMVWPRLVQRHTVHFPLTAVGNFSVELALLTHAFRGRLSI